MNGHLVLSGGPVHDFAATTEMLVALATDAGMASTVVTDPAEFFDRLRSSASGSGGQWSAVTVNALRWRMTAARYAAQRKEFAYEAAAEDLAILTDHVRGGGGLLAMHTAVICFDAAPMWTDLLGGAWNWEHSGHGPPAPTVVACTAAGRAHPTTRAATAFTVTDEVYRGLDVATAVQPLLTATDADADHPVVWAREHGRGRVVTDVLGHDTESLRHPAHAELLRSAYRWIRRRDPSTIATSSRRTPEHHS